MFWVGKLRNLVLTPGRTCRLGERGQHIVGASPFTTTIQSIPLDVVPLIDVG